MNIAKSIFFIAKNHPRIGLKKTALISGLRTRQQTDLYNTSRFSRGLQNLVSISNSGVICLINKYNLMKAVKCEFQMNSS